MRTRKKKKKKKKKKLVCVRACVFFGTHQTESQSRAFITRAQRGFLERGCAVALYDFLYKKQERWFENASRVAFRIPPGGARTPHAPQIFLSSKRISVSSRVVTVLCDVRSSARFEHLAHQTIYECNGGTEAERRKAEQQNRV